MLKTIEMNGLKNVVPVNVALGDKSEHRDISICGSGSSLVMRNPKNQSCDAKKVVKIITLDDFVAENNLEVGMIKADIEGFEQHMLRGAEKTIISQKPVLRICIYHNVSDFLDIKPMIEAWDLGYKFRIIKPVDGSVCGETALIAEVI
jgi:FkbM family methyltransferase